MVIKQVLMLSPAYNAERMLEPFLEGGDLGITPVREIYERLSERGILYSHLVVNDGSTDSTQQRLEDIKRRNPWLQVLENERNMGVGEVIKIGYQNLVDRASTELDTSVVGRLDCDLEHNPKEIIALVEKLGKVSAQGAISQLLYQREHQKGIDFAFDYSQGITQGEVILGKGRWFYQNCPGFSMWRAEAMAKILPEYKSYLEGYQKKYGISPKWGGDLAIMFCAKRLGYGIDTSIKVPSTRAPQNRDVNKIMAQIERNRNHLDLMRELQTRGSPKVI